MPNQVRNPLLLPSRLPFVCAFRFCFFVLFLQVERDLCVANRVLFSLSSSSLGNGKQIKNRLCHPSVSSSYTEISSPFVSL